MPLKASIPFVMMTLVGLLLAPVANGADRRIQVESSETRGVIAAVLDKSRKAEIQLRDGTRLSGTVIGANVPGLLLEVKKHIQSVPYDQLVTIRLDLGPNRGWRSVGTAIGVATGIGLLLAAIKADNGPAQYVAVAALFAGPLIGGKLGGRHRNWLIVEVH